jgi:hypothetical protein
MKHFTEQTDLLNIPNIFSKNPSIKEAEQKSKEGKKKLLFLPSPAVSVEKYCKETAVSAWVMRKLKEGQNLFV